MRHPRRKQAALVCQNGFGATYRCTVRSLRALPFGATAFGESGRRAAGTGPRFIVRNELSRHPAIWVQVTENELVNGLVNFSNVVERLIREFARA